MPTGADYNAAVVSRSPLEYHRFDETDGPTLFDNSGHGHNLTYSATGVTYRVPGPFSGMFGVTFNGSTGKVTPNTKFYQRPMSYAFWVKLTSSNGPFFTTRYSGGDSDPNLVVDCNASGQLEFYNNGSNYGGGRYSTETVNNGNWRMIHCVQTYADDAPGFLMYIDTVETTYNFLGFGANTGFHNGIPYSVGEPYFAFMPATGGYLAFSISGFAVFDYALSASDRSTLFSPPPAPVIPPVPPPPTPGYGMFPTPTPVIGGEFRVVIGDLRGNPLEEVPWQNLQFSYVLNAPGSISFGMHHRAEKATKTLLAEGRRSVLVFRKGFLVWGGYLWGVNGALSSGLQLAGAGWWSRIRRRIYDATKTWTNLDQFDIVWDMLNYTQAQTDGDLGIVRYSPAASGILRTETLNLYEQKFIGEFIEQMAARERGFDFEVTPNRLWRTYYPRKGGPSTHVFALGKNVSGYASQGDASDMATWLTAIGAGDESGKVLSTVVDPVQRARYGLLMDTTSFVDVSIQTTLDDHAKEELKNRKVPRLTPELAVVTDDPPFGLYQTGDEVLVDVHDGYFQIHDYFRIISIVLAVSNEGREAPTIFFDSNLAGGVTDL